MTRAILTVVGHDKTGVIAKFSATLSANNANILDVNQNIMNGDIFAMMMLIDVSGLSCSFKELSAALTEDGNALEMSVHVMHEDVFNAMHHV
ncbi:MAG: ACT domain-containing protein [Butyricicoccaceae bacterium]